MKTIFHYASTLLALLAITGCATKNPALLSAQDEVHAYKAALQSLDQEPDNTVQPDAKRAPWISMGMTHMRFDREGRITLHQDYWDSSAGIYEHLPVVGGLIRYVQRRI